MKKDQWSTLAIVTLTLISIAAVLGGIFSSRGEEVLSVVTDVLLTLLPIAADVLYLIGSGLIVFGVVLITVRFVKTKLKDPCQPTGLTRYLSGYLSLGLEIFIGAELVLTATKQTWEEFAVLFTTIVARFLLSLVLYLEGRWHHKEDAETVCEV